MRTIGRLLVACSIGILTWSNVNAADEYQFKGGFPTPETVQKNYDGRKNHIISNDL